MYQEKINEGSLEVIGNKFPYKTKESTKNQGGEIMQKKSFYENSHSLEKESLLKIKEFLETNIIFCKKSLLTVTAKRKWLLKKRVELRNTLRDVDKRINELELAPLDKNDTL